MNPTVWKNVPAAHMEGPAGTSGMFTGRLRGGIGGIGGVCPQFVVGLGSCSPEGWCGAQGAAGVL